MKKIVVLSLLFYFNSLFIKYQYVLRVKTIYVLPKCTKATGVKLYIRVFKFHRFNFSLKICSCNTEIHIIICKIITHFTLLRSEKLNK